MKKIWISHRLPLSNRESIYSKASIKAAKDMNHTVSAGPWIQTADLKTGRAGKGVGEFKLFGTLVTHAHQMGAPYIQARIESFCTIAQNAFPRLQLYLSLQRLFWFPLHIVSGHPRFHATW